MKLSDNLGRRGWRKSILGDYVALSNGKGITSSQMGADKPIPVYGSGSIIGYTDKPLVFYDTIVIGRVGACGTVQIAKAPCWISDNAMYVTQIKPGLDFHFLFFLLSYLRLGTLASRTTQPSLPQGPILNHDFLLPPLPVQERIVEILQKADEIQRKRKEAMELVDKILPTLFLEMFGDPATNPKGYERVTIGEVTTLVTSGYTPRGGARNYVTEGPLLLRSQNIQMLRLDLEDCVHLPEHIFRDMQRVHVRQGDVLLNITGKGTAGRVAWVESSNLRAAVNQHVCIIRPKPDRIRSEYLAFILSTLPYQRIIENAPGSAQSGFNQARVRALEILVPPLPVQDAFVAQVRALAAVRTKCLFALDSIERGFEAMLTCAFTGELTAEWEAANAEWIAKRQAVYGCEGG